MKGVEPEQNGPEQGLDGFGVKTVKLQGGKALFIKAYSVKWHFPPFQIKMLKHNKYTVHLTSSQDPKCNPITFLPSTQSLFLLNSNRVSGFCASIKVRV